MKKTKKDKEVIWRLDVSDEFLTFTQEPRPENFFELATKHDDYGEYSGTFCGHRGYYDTVFKLHRKLEASDFYSGYCGSKTKYKDEWGNFSLRVWREAYGFSYAWEPQQYYRYNGNIYTTHINFR